MSILSFLLSLQSPLVLGSSRSLRNFTHHKQGLQCNDIFFVLIQSSAPRLKQLGLSVDVLDQDGPVPSLTSLDILD